MIDNATSRVLPTRQVGRYALYDEIGHGGTASVHLGRLLGPAGFAKTVAIKRMHPSVGRDPEVAAMFIDEARISGRIRHPNVVGTSDLLSVDDDLFLILEYVHGESLAALLERLNKTEQRMPVPVAVHVLRDALHGLHAAHEALDETGQPLGLVHRDVSPQNVLVGVDGVARVLDFGIAKALGRLQDTHTGQVKGKVAYMAPEQLLGQRVDRRTDIFAAGVMLWETLSGKRLFRSPNPGETVQRVLNAEVPLLSDFVPGVSPALAQVVARAIERPIERRYATAHDFACALEAVTELVSPRAVGEWVEHVAGDQLERRSARLRQIESASVVAAGLLSVSEVEENEITGLRASSPEFRALERADDGATRTRTATWIAGADSSPRPLRRVDHPTDSTPELTPAVAPTALDSRAFAQDALAPAQPGHRLLWWGAAALLLGGALLAVLGPWQNGTPAASAASIASPPLSAPRPPPATQAKLAPPAVEEANRNGAPSAEPAPKTAVSGDNVANAKKRSSVAPSSAPSSATAAAKRAKAKAAASSTTTTAPKRAEDLFSRN